MASVNYSRPLRPSAADSYSARDRQSNARAPPTLDTSLTRSGTVDDILGAYGDSPTKTRHAPEPQRFDSSYTSLTTASGSSSRDEMAGLPVLDHRNERAELRASQRNSAGRSRPAGASRTKSSGDLDVIDRLDISGLYGGGSFVRHEGPYAAASTTRNQGSLAPIAAFDPSAFTLTPSPASSSASSMRRAHSSGFPATTPPSALSRSEGPYGAATKAAVAASPATKRDISLGYPSSQREDRGKGAQLLEIYGVQDNEAWEDYGQATYDSSKAASKESVGQAGPAKSKEDRFLRTQSIWDIEATLKAGKPVGQAPPPVPVMPSEFAPPAEVSPSNKPKRSKSLAARFRAGRKNPNSPMADDLTVQVDDGREAGQASSVPTSPVEDRPRGGGRGHDWPLAASMPASAGTGRASSAAGSRRGSEATERGPPLEIRTAALRFEDAPSPRSPVERLGGGGGLGRTWTDESATGSPTTSKKEKGGLKRLFSTKRKG